MLLMMDGDLESQQDDNAEPMSDFALSETENSDTAQMHPSEVDRD